MTTCTRSLKPGIYAPIPSFFIPGTEDLDLPTFEDHIVRVATAGVVPLIAGSMGEAIHLTRAERTALTTAARTTLDRIGLSRMPIITGTGTGSTRETIELCNEAAQAGADFAIVISSGYFAGVLAGDKQALKAFYTAVADKSPIPVMIYNYPAASGGIDLDSDIIIELALECPNICGVKLTCGNVGKLTRIASIVSSESFAETSPRKNLRAPFLVLGGFIDFMIPSAYVNGHGAITGLGNIAPHAIMKLYQLSEASKRDASLLSEAQRLQGIIAHADFTISKASIAGTKFLLQKMHGYGGLPRKPLPPLDSVAAEALWEHLDTQELLKLEHETMGKSP